MYEACRAAYARLRVRPLVGPALSRLVWAAKGLLGRPVRGTVEAPAPPARSGDAPRLDPALQVALAAVEALGRRVAALEGPEPPRAAVAPAPPAAGTPSVSVVVCTLDRADWLDRALAALAFQRHPAFEVIVVAGPCRDGTAAVLARHAPRVRVAGCAEANLSAARNIGVALAAGEVVAFLDDDAAPEPDWLQRLCRPYADPGVGGVGGVLRDAGGVAFQCRAMVADRFGSSVEADPQRLPPLDLPGDGVERYLSLTGANSSFRRSALLAAGGFDEHYAYFLDETDLCLRLVEAGWRLEVAQEAEVHHGYAPSAQRDAVRTPLSLYDPVRSTAYFAIRNGQPRRGWAEAAMRLKGSAEDLHRDIDWRQTHGGLQPGQGERLHADVERGLASGVRAALEGPRRLMGAPPAALRRRPPAAAPVRRAEAERLRIGLLSQDYPDGCERASPPGGVAVWTQALARGLAARGHEVSVFTRAAAGAPPSVAHEAADGAGAWVHRYDPAGGGDRSAPLLAGLPASVARPAAAAAREVARVEPRRAFDLLMGPLWDLEPAALLDAGPWPVAVSLHTACAQMGAYKPEWTDGYRRSHVDRVVAGERRLLRRAAHILSNSRAAACDIGGALGLPDLAGRAAVIPHGLPDLAHGVAGRPPDGSVEVLFVGRLELRKGVDVLLEAAPALLAAAPHVRLTLAGEDVFPPVEAPWRRRFEARHAGAPWLDRVRFAGALPREALLALYAGSDIVVVPSRYESFGLVALEAMIFAKPCVASRVGGLPEVVVEGETGLLTPPGDAAALLAALLALAGAPERRAALGAGGRRRYEAGFTVERMAERFENWARAVAADRNRLAAE